MEKELLTLSVPFEKDVFFDRNTCLFAITSKKTDDDIIDHVADCYNPDYGIERTKYSDDCVARIYDFESGKQLFVVDALDTASIRQFLSQQQIPELFKNPNATYKYVRDIQRTFKRGHKIVHKIEVINDILVFRFFYFLPNFFEEGKREGYREITRFCFKGDECWKENRDGNRYKLDTQYIYFKGTKESISERIETGESVVDTVRKVYPTAPNYCYSFRDFLYYFNNLYKGDVVNKNVPKNIREHLNRTYQIRPIAKFETSSRYDDDYEGLPEDMKKTTHYDCINVATGKGLVCYLYFNDKGINTERLYFTKTKTYRFGYNEFRNCWVSTKKQIMAIMKQYVPYNGKTDTLMDYYGEMLPNERSTFAQVFMAIESPLIEKLYKMGLKKLVQSSYTRTMETDVPRTSSVLKLIAESMDMPYDRKTMENMEPYQLFGVGRGQMKYINRETMSGADIFAFRKAMTHERIMKIFPDVQKRIAFSQLFLQRCGIPDLDSMEVEKLKYIGKIATSDHDALDRSRIFMQYDDYLRVREEAVAYNEYLERLNQQDHGTREIFKYEIYPKVSRIKFLHDKANRDATYYRQIKDKDKLAIQDQHIQEFVTSDEYTNLLYDDETFTIVTPEDTASLIYEGNYLSHCVGTYAPNVANKRSYIYFLRQKEDVNTPFFTMEVVKRNNGYELKQCYTFHDSTTKSKKCKNFIENWCESKKIRIGCTL